MPDQRLEKLAQTLIHYSIEIKPGDQLEIRTNPLAQELALLVYEQAVQAGAYILITQTLPGDEEVYYKNASDEQLDYVSPVRKLITESFDAILVIGAEYNTRSLSAIDPQRISRSRKATTELTKIFLKRAANLELRWCYTEFPTYASAQEADMSLNDYQEFVYAAGLLNEPDPVAVWREEGVRQRKLIGWLSGRDLVEIKGNNADLTFSIKDRKFKEADGKYNFPDGEIFTGPVEESANGWIRFSYPAIYQGQEVIDVELWFENGKVVKETATKGKNLLTSSLNTDQGARFLGEWGIGTNYGIQRFTKNMLFDEKMGGTIHLALGSGYPETGSKNESAIHWDMLCDMAESEINVDGEIFYENGKFRV
ncbi:MAG TPA: aminopeptidase [Anaerolineales bacterium]|nr:aminopeptidase [Anaerolineales bacterium]